MSILQYKYKAHRLVNTLFYVIVFVIGFLLGFTSNKIDFNKLLSQVLMIDSVSAYTIYEDEDKKINEEYIYNSFVEYYKEFNIENTPYITCSFYSYSNGRQTITCHAFSENALNAFTYTRTENNYYVFGLNFNEYEFGIDYVSFAKNINSLSISESYPNVVLFYFDDSNNITYSNFDIEIDGEIRNDWNLLDFNGVDSEFNPNLFKDNPDFKEVCVNKQDIIAITRTSNPENADAMMDFDYIWFPFNIQGLKSYNYQNADLINDSIEDVINKIDWSSDNIYEYDNYTTNFYYDKDAIDSVWDDESKGENLKFKGYVDRYSYYGWSSALFNLWFDYTDGNNFNFIPIFEFEDTYILESIDGIGASIPNFDFDGDISNDGKICFYIKNEYEVTIVHKDEFGDIYGDVPTQNGDFNISTSKNKNNISSSGLMSQVNNFISHISGTINFIRDSIYSFYLSLPILVRMFLISIFVILIVKFIIGMVVR